MLFVINVDLDACVDGVLDLPDSRHDLLVEIVVDEAVQGGVGDGAGHPQQVGGHVGDHQGLWYQDNKSDVKEGKID